MSFFDIRYNKEKESSWIGMEPPDLYIGSIITDLKWHNRLYRVDKLSLSTRLAFLFLRILQQFSYFIGWNKSKK